MLTISVGHSGRRFDDSDVHFVTILAGRVALALDNAGLFSDLERSERERAEIAETLQRGLLPPPLPHIPGWSVAATYRPAGAENEIGGDFYDAFRIAGGWMVVIGDVTGRGAKAAAVTAHARYTLRTAAALTGDPVVALRTLNRELLARQGTALCSVAAMAISEDPAEPVRLAVAGHPPPLLVDGDRGHRGRPARRRCSGAFTDETWTLESTHVAPGQQLVVVTDGVTEMGGDGERFGEERLRAAAGGRRQPRPRSAADRGRPARVRRRHPRRRRRDPRDRAGRRRGRAGLRRTSASWSSASSRPSTAATRRRSSPSATRGWASSRSAPPKQSAAPPPTSVPQGLHEYLRDVDRAWDELLISPKVVEKPRQLAAGPGPGLRPQPPPRHPRHPRRLDLGPRRRPLHPRRGLPRPRGSGSAARRPRPEGTL